MKSIETTRYRRQAFAVLAASRSSQAATMILAPGEASDEDGAGNEHPWAEQWLYVVEGSGTARVGRRTVRLRAGSLLLIEKREPHVIRAGKRSRLVTLNVYVPPAYRDDGEPLTTASPPRSTAATRT